MVIIVYCYSFSLKLLVSFARGYLQKLQNVTTDCLKLL